MSGYRQERQLPTGRNVRRDDMSMGNQMKSLVPRSVTGGPRRRDDHPVTVFLREIGMVAYAETLRNSGFDDMETLMDMQEEHMRELGMPSGHIVKLKRRLRDCQTSRPTLLGRTSGASATRIPGKMDSTIGSMTAVQQSWHHLKDIGTDVVGGFFYRKFFVLAPSAKVCFPISIRLRYKDWGSVQEETDDPADSPALNKLFARFVEVIGNAVAGIQDTSKMVPMLQQLGMRHVAYGLKSEYFETAGTVIIDVLAELLGDIFTKEVENAWVMVSGFVTATMHAGWRTGVEIAAKAKEAQLKYSSTNGSTEGDDESRAGLDNASDAGSARIGSSGDKDMRAALSLPISDGGLGLSELGTTPIGGEKPAVVVISDCPAKLKTLVEGSSGGCYGIEWSLSDRTGRLEHKSHYNPQWRIDTMKSLGAKGLFTTRSRAFSFMPGQGAVGEAFAKQESLFLQDPQTLNRHMSTPFQRADLAKEFGILSIMFVPFANGVWEVGSSKRFTSGMDFIPPDLMADAAE